MNGVADKGQSDSAATMFDVCGELPSGLTVLEASAGTGKTFTIAALVARYVASGVALEHLLVVTFTRMATGELRERVRERLVSAEAGLRRALDGVAPDPADSVLALLADADVAEVEARRRRLADALADFDAATIATTHGFCQHILSGLGVAGDVEAGATFVEDTNDLVSEVVDDLYVRHVLRSGFPGFERSEARTIATAAIASPAAPIEPRGAPKGSVFATRVKLAYGVRQHVEGRKLRAGLLTYDDLLTRLAATLADHERGPGACERLRQRYRVALVDEFQDTDPVQWEILRRAFGEGGATLVLIGDPKQAIYSFRGADVYAYLDAAHTATTTATLGTNWRSDQGLIDACRALFANARLGHPDITFRTVQATPDHHRAGLVGAPVANPMRVRVVDRLQAGVQLTPHGYVAKGSGEAYVAADVAGDVVSLLGSGAELVDRDGGVGDAQRRPLRPGHVAVLVRTNRQAVLARDALDAAGVPAVINGAGSVFATAVAGDWLRLLEALQRPASPSRARAAALTSLVGWSAESVANAGDAALEGLQTELSRWAAVLERRGVASLMELVTRTTLAPGTTTLPGALPARLLGRTGGERDLTDLRHVGQLLHAEAVAEGLGTSALVTWLRRRIAEATRETAAEERTRRLESDAEAVQVLTIHRSKGLEFPVVYAPFLWADLSVEDQFPAYHDTGGGGVRTVDVGGKGGPDHERHLRWRREEERGEDLRLAYVALTRACHQVVLWWAGSMGSRSSPLSRLLFSRQPDGEVATDAKKVPGDDEASAVLEALAAASGGAIAVERAGPARAWRWLGADASPVALGVRRFERTLDSDWSRTSYTALVSGAHSSTNGTALVASEPELAEMGDEVLSSGVPSPGAAGAAAGDVGSGEGRSEERHLRGAPSLWGNLAGGARTGTLVHAVLERIDFAATDLDSELAGQVGEQVVRRMPELADGHAVNDLALALRAAIETPLGPLFGDVRLRDVEARDRLDELGFELPLAGGDSPSHDVAVGALSRLLRRRVPAGDPLAGYADRLSAPSLDKALRGYLTGSIDLVVRRRGAPDPGGAGVGSPGIDRFTVIDYKTNWLGSDGEALTAWHYRPVALAETMQAAHYPLQALLYAVALHRYLRWRLPGYDPDRNLAGVAYLFVRGMTGAGVPRVDGQPCGVFSWRPPLGLVAELSDLLDRGDGLTERGNGR